MNNPFVLFADRVLAPALAVASRKAAASERPTQRYVESAFMPSP
jgi:hypothetical protein